jgi:hypothetical protein
MKVIIAIAIAFFFVIVIFLINNYLNSLMVAWGNLGFIIDIVKKSILVALVLIILAVSASHTGDGS